jgi:hypothetical protein
MKHNHPTPADYIDSYFVYMRQHFSREESIKIFGQVTGNNLYDELLKFNGQVICESYLFWHCFLTESEQNQIAEYAYNYLKNI